MVVVVKDEEAEVVGTRVVVVANVELVLDEAAIPSGTVVDATALASIRSASATPQTTPRPTAASTAIPARTATRRRPVSQSFTAWPLVRFDLWAVGACALHDAQQPVSDVGRMQSASASSPLANPLPRSCLVNPGLERRKLQVSRHREGLPISHSCYSSVTRSGRRAAASPRVDTPSLVRMAET